MGEIMNGLYRGAFQSSEQIGLKKKIKLQKESVQAFLNDEGRELLEELLEDVSMLKNLYLQESFNSGFSLGIGMLSELNYEVRSEWDDVLAVKYEFDFGKSVRSGIKNGDVKRESTKEENRI